MTQHADRKGIWGWMLFDWANQPFYTLIITFIFAPYFAAEVASNSVDGQAMWADVTTIASLIIAFTAPILGAIADQSGPRKPWIFFFAVLFVLGCSVLWLAEPGMSNPTVILIAFAAAFIGSEFMLIFTNAMLPDLVPRREVGKVSGSGWGVGYLGGLVTLFLMLLFLSPAPGSEVTLLGIKPLFGLDVAQGEPARSSGPLSALWFIIFIIPLFLYTPDVPRKPRSTGVVKDGISTLVKTIKSLKNHRSLLSYLIASMFYRDGLAALFLFGGIFAKGVLGWGLFQLAIFGILSTFTGSIGAWFGGRMDKKYGPKPVIIFTIIVLVIVATVTLMTSREAVVFISVSAESSLPDIVFYACGALLGAGSGSLQAASRTLMIHQAEGRMPMTEAFGLYALSGKSTAFLGPILIGLSTRISDSQQIGIAPVVGLLVIGLICLLWVNTKPEH